MQSINWAELERIRATVSAPASTMNERALRKTEKKKLSEERVKNWPNTLDALRLKKENYARVKAEEEEQKRIEIDRQEADLRKTMRLEAIERATALLYEQTDKMKVLKSQKLYADVLHDRKSQIEVVQKRKDSEKIEAVKNHQDILRQIAAAKVKEEEEITKRKELVKTITSIRERQLVEVKKQRDAEKEEMKAIGVKLKQQAEEDLRLESIRHQEKMERIRQSNKDTILANEQIRLAKLEIQRKEKEEEEILKQKNEEIEQRKVILKQLDQERFMRSQVVRQKLIDRAVKSLEAWEDNQNRIFEKQAEEKRAKEDADLASRQAARDKEKQLIREQREGMIARRRAEKEREQEENMARAALVKAKYLEETQKEEKKQQHIRELTKDIKEIQYTTAVDKRRKKIEEKIIEIEKDRLIQSVYEHEDDKFAEVCKKKIEEYEAAGKPTLTLYRALETSQPVLIAAPLNKTASIKKKE